MSDGGSETQHDYPRLRDHVPDRHLRHLLAGLQSRVVGLTRACIQTKTYN